MNKKIIVLALSSLLIAPFAQASQVFLETTTRQVGVGQKMEIAVSVDSQGQRINALEGIIHIPSLVSVKSIRDGNSLIPLWVERPHILTTAQGQDIVFSGVIPGGWEGRSGQLFSLVVESVEAGNASLTFSGVRIFLHDGLGTPDQATTATLTLRIDEKVELIPVPEEEADLEAPEAFVPLISSDLTIFSGESFLSFVTQDKASGIDHYEIFESPQELSDPTEGDYSIATSPYRIQDQTLQSFIYVKAIDRAGNERLAIVPAVRVAEEPVPAVLLRNKTVYVIALLALIILIFIVKRAKKQKRR